MSKMYQYAICWPSTIVTRTGCIPFMLFNVEHSRACQQERLKRLINGKVIGKSGCIWSTSPLSRSNYSAVKTWCTVAGDSCMLAAAQQKLHVGWYIAWCVLLSVSSADKNKLTNGKEEKKNWQYSSHYTVNCITGDILGMCTLSSAILLCFVTQSIHLVMSALGSSWSSGHSTPRFLLYHVWQSSKMLLCHLQNLLSLCLTWYIQFIST